MSLKPQIEIQQLVPRILIQFFWQFNLHKAAFSLNLFQLGINIDVIEVCCKKNWHYFAFFPTANRKRWASGAVCCIPYRLWLSLWWNSCFSDWIMLTSHLRSEGKYLLWGNHSCCMLPCFSTLYLYSTSLNLIFTEPNPTWDVHSFLDLCDGAAWGQVWHKPEA